MMTDNKPIYIFYKHQGKKSASKPNNRAKL